MEDLFVADRLARSGANENCSMSLDEVRAISPNLSTLNRIQVDRNTIIFYDPTKTTAKRIRDNYNIYIKYKKKQWIKKESDMTHE
ncbi:MAG: hypothetical protein SNH27_07350 [Rikenellaceae bacterium]